MICHIVYFDLFSELYYIQIFVPMSCATGFTITIGNVS